MTATFPDGRRQTLLNVRRDFNWQLFYYPKTKVPLPRGTRIDLVAHYDNSAANKHNPDPSRAVTFGEASTTSEMMFGMFEFTADAGVSPKPSTERERMEALVASLPADSSFLIDLPFGPRGLPAVLHLPRTGEGAFYTQVLGVILPQPVARLQWDGNSFRFNTLLRILNPAGGFYTVTGTIGDDGTVRGKLRRLENNGRPQPSFDTRRPQATRSSG